MEASTETTRLIQSASKGEFDTIAQAIEAGVQADLANASGKSLAHAAAAGGHTKILRHLVSSGCNIHARDVSGNSLAHEAARRGQLDVLKLLKKVGADLGGINKKGETVEAVAKEPHIKDYVAYVSGRKREPAGGDGQKHSVRQRKKPLGNKNKKELLKWKRERDRTRRQNEDDSDWGSGRPLGQNGQGSGAGGDKYQRFSQVESSGLNKGFQGEEPLDYFHDMVEVLDVSYMNFTAQQQLVEEDSSSCVESDSESGEDEPVEDSQNVADSLFMPRCKLEELGWSEEGFSVNFPQRPAWQGVVSNGQELNDLEEKVFIEWQESISTRFGDDRVSSYEKNLNYWRQLWRVLERGDICLIIVDARNPLLHLSHSLYTYATNILGLKVVILMNKSDLVPLAAIDAWKEYLGRMYPGINVIPVSAKKGGEELTRRAVLEVVLRTHLRSDPDVTVSDAIGMNVEEVLDFREKTNAVFEGKCLVGPEDGEDSDKGRKKGIRAKRREERREKRKAKARVMGGDTGGDKETNGNHDFDLLEPSGVAQKHRSRPVVVCVVGEPNVGKSSTMNALLGMKKMAVSNHPGRTKHYQTYYLTPRLMLCDCPGLVFPRLDVVQPLQVLYGSYPISRCRNPYSVVKYLAERIWPRLDATLNLVKDEEASGDLSGDGRPWTAHWICEAFASRKKWFTTRGGRLDTYRSANWILRSALGGTGQIRLAFYPPENQPWPE